MKLKVFVGPKGSGKDTCATIIEDLGITKGKIPFAGPLKSICASVFDIELEVFEHPILKERAFPHPHLITFDECLSLIREMNFFVPASKACVTEVMNFEGSRLYSPRHMLQFIGTEIIRNKVDPNWHCKAAFSEPAQDTFSVTDCRFLNEYYYLKDNHDCEFFYVERPEAEDKLALATHQSELEIREVEKRLLKEGGKIIRNDSDILSLATALKELIR